MRISSGPQGARKSTPPPTQFGQQVAPTPAKILDTKIRKTNLAKNYLEKVAILGRKMTEVSENTEETPKGGAKTLNKSGSFANIGGWWWCSMGREVIGTKKARI